MIKENSMLAFWERVRNLLTHDLNQAWLCRKLGIASATMSTWVTHDRLPKADMAVRIAQALGVSAEYLVTGKDSLEDDEDLHGPSGIPVGQFITPAQKEYTLSETQRVVNIPILNQKVSAGHGENVIEQFEPEKVLPVLERLVARYKKEQLRVVEVKGDSMTGVQLFNGDLAVFAAEHIEGDGIYVISLGDEAMVKRLEFDKFNNIIKVKSENRNYDPIVVPAESENMKIEGKVVGWYHNHPY